jgi:hypothetical protein
MTADWTSNWDYLAGLALSATCADELSTVNGFTGKDAEAVVLDLVQPAGSGGRAASVGSHGRRKPAGGFLRQRGAGARHNADHWRACNASPALTRIRG